MKKHILTLSIVTLLLSVAIAQPNPNMRDGKGPQQKGDKLDRIAQKLELTDAQKDQFEIKMIALHQEVQPLQNQLREKRAGLKTLVTASTIDNKKVNKTIEEIGALETSLLKSKINHQIAIRSLLNDKQKMIFDKSQEERKKGNKGQEMRKPGRG